MAKHRAHDGVDDVSMGARLPSTKDVAAMQNVDSEGRIKFRLGIIVIIRRKFGKRNTI
jgi:hypothetical protein